MEAKGLKNIASRIFVMQNETDLPRCCMEALCAFILASAGRYGCSPFGAAICSAAWFYALSPCVTALAAILGAMCADSMISVVACMLTAGAELLLSAFKDRRGEEAPPYMRFTAALVAQSVPLAAVFTTNRRAFLLGMGALLATVPLSYALVNAWGAMWAYVRGKRLRRTEAAALVLFMCVLGICAYFGGAKCIAPLILCAACALSLSRANRLAVRELSDTRSKLNAAAAVAQQMAETLPHCGAYLCGMGMAMERMSLPNGQRRTSLGVEAGAAAVAMAKSPTNGDSMAIRRMGRELLLVLSDGMGTGSLAHRESTRAVEMYGELMSIGFMEEDAVRSINEFMYSTNTDELYATLDAVKVDLATGDAIILKQSAPPAFLIHDGSIRALYAEAPPLGILKEMQIGLGSARVCAGDTLVLMTDGLSDALGTELYAAMHDVVEEELPPRQAARALIRRAGGVSERDDMSAIVARFYSCHKKAQF